MHTTKYIIAIILGFWLVGCQDFEQMNENPNEPTEVTSDVLLASGMRQVVTTVTEESFLLGNNAAQITTKTLRTEVDAYNWNAFPTLWDGLYSGLTDLHRVEAIALESGNMKMQGVALVMQTYAYSVLTNAYGDIPFSEAIQGDDNIFTPVYDSQEEVYTSMLNNLDGAVAMLEGDGQIAGDIIYGNDADKWIKFAHSLKLRLLMSANAKIANAQEQFAAIVTDGRIMTSNDDNATLSYLSGFPNQFPLIPLKTGDFDAVALSQNMYNSLIEHNDPRLSRYARPNDDNYDVINDSTSFSGAVNGSNSGNCSKDGSRLGPQFYNYPGFTDASTLGLSMAEGILMTYSELCFILAEAAEKGWVANTTADEYKMGVQASMDYYQVNYAAFGYTDFEDFYANSGIAFSEASDIWRQKWTALFFHGMEPYFEVRRWYVESGDSFDNIPFLDVPCEDLNGGKLPMRFLYPGEEQSLNAANYNAAVEKLGDINDKMWLVN